MNEEILEFIVSKGITRLCHFTPSRNLQHIAAGKTGILSTAKLEAAERETFNPTDLERLDNKTTHICCSIEYPNAWYFEKARSKERIFTDWVVLLISPLYLAKEDTLFCPRNAAANYGRLIEDGPVGLQKMFAERISGAAGRVYSRGALHKSSCPTDQQAEVLIRDQIHMKDILAVAVKTKEQARSERVALRTNGVDPELFKFVVAPQMFDKYALNNVVTQGGAAIETEYVSPAV